MGNFFRRTLAFIFGMVFGIVALSGAIAGTAYWAFKHLSLEKVGASQEMLGDMNGFTVEEWTALIVSANKNPNEFTLQKLEEYGFNLDEFVSKMGVKVDEADPRDVQAVKDLAPVALFSTANGFKNLNAGIIFAFISKGSNGRYPVFSEHARDYLRSLTIGELIKKDEITGKPAILSYLSSLKIGAVLSSFFEETYNDVTNEYEYESENELLKNIGNIYFSLITDSVIGGKAVDIGYELNEGNLTGIGEKPLNEFIAELFVKEDSGKQDFVDKFDYLDMLVKSLFVYNTEESKYKFDFMNFAGGIKIGDIAGVEQCTKDALCTIHNDVSNCTGNWYTADGTEITDITTKLYGYTVADLINGFKDGTLVDLLMGDSYIGDFMFKRGDTSDPSYCPSNCDNDTEGHEHKFYWLDADDNELTGIYKKLANVSVSKLLGGEGGLDFGELVSDMTLGELMGFTYDSVNDKWLDSGVEVVPETAMEKIICNMYGVLLDDLRHGNVDLGDVAGDITVGELMSYKKVEGVWKDSSNNSVSAINAKIADVKLSELISGDGNFFNNLLNGMKIGDLMGYTYNEVSGEWLDNGTPVSGIIQKIAGLETTNIDNVNNFKIGELMGYTYDEVNNEWLDGGVTVTGINGKVADYTLNTINDIQLLKVGELMDCYNDGGVWKKKDDDEPLTGLNGKLADYTIQDISNGSISTSNFVLGDVISDTSGMFELMDLTNNPNGGYYASASDVPVDDIASRMQSGITNAKVGKLIDLGIIDLDEDKIDTFYTAKKGSSYVWKNEVTVSQLLSDIIDSLTLIP